MHCDWLIAIDDTDNEESIGTGRLARMLASHLTVQGLIEASNVTRHQLLVHPDIPYTSHNSSACIAARGEDSSGQKIFDLARSFLVEHEHEGANAGLCVCRSAEVPEDLPVLARRAQREVLDLVGFDAEIARHRLSVYSQGETGQGRIGAVCGVALRSTGNDGRFIELAGIRDVEGRATVADILARSGVDAVVDETDRELAPEVEIETRDWLRPNLTNGRALFRVCREGEDWVPIEKHSRDDG